MSPQRPKRKVLPRGAYSPFRMTYDSSLRMPISGATINLICPTCGACIDLELEQTQPKETPQPQLTKTIPYRCTVCDHLGAAHVTVQVQ